MWTRGVRRLLLLLRAGIIRGRFIIAIRRVSAVQIMAEAVDIGTFDRRNPHRERPLGPPRVLRFVRRCPAVAAAVADKTIIGILLIVERTFVSPRFLV